MVEKVKTKREKNKKRHVVDPWVLVVDLLEQPAQGRSEHDTMTTGR